MATYDGLVLQVSLQCPSCMQPLHVQGLADRELCPACSAATELPLETWAGWFGPAEVADALSMDDGEARQISSLGGTNAKYAFGHRMPRCQACKVPVPADRLEALAAEGAYACACGEKIRVRPATELARVLVPGARFLVNEGPTGDGPDTVETTAGAEPVLFACMACGGSLRVDGKTRTVTCEFCSGSNYLPDGLWLRLHPPRTVRTFFLVLERGGSSGLPPELLAKLAASDDSDSRKLAAANPDADVDVLRRLAGDDDDEVRAAVAGNPRTPAELVDELVADSSYRTRVAAVRSGRASVAALVRQLPEDFDSDVLEAVASLDPLHPDVLAAMAGSHSYDARRLVARHKSTPAATLVLLASDRDSDVIAALCARTDLPAEAVLTLAASDDEAVASSARARPQYVAAASSRRKRWIIGGAVTFVVLGCMAGGTGVLALIGMAARMALRHHH